MHPGSNGSPVVNGGSNNYDRAVCFDAPVAMDTGLFVDPTEKTLAALREEMMVRLGYAAMLASPPPGMTEWLNSHLQDAQDQLYYKYSTLHTERWWAWQMQPGKRFYDVPVDCTKYLNFRRLTWAGIADNGGRALRSWMPETAYALGEFVMSDAGLDLEYEVTTAGTTAAAQPVWPTIVDGTITDGTVTYTARRRNTVRWLSVQQGINPLDYGAPSGGEPTHFDLTDRIEVWPAPTRPMVLWLKGHMGLKRFTEDADVPTLDSRAVFLYALANAKAEKGHPDARNVMGMAMQLVGGYVAGAHGLRRYLPRPSTLGMKFGAFAPPCALPRATWR